MKKQVPLDALILTIRDRKVILDADLAELYGVTTGALNQAVKRNTDRFPADFAFRLTAKEMKGLLSQFVIANTQDAQTEYDGLLKPQSAPSGRGGRRTPPHAFTEHGALMAANVLNSPEAVSMSVYVVRAFIQQREMLLAHSEILKKLGQMDAKLLQHDDTLRAIVRELQPLLTSPPAPAKPRIGFHQP